MDIGRPGEDKAITNPLSRSLNYLLEHGFPFKRFTLGFWASTPFREEIQNYNLFWFGVFLLSQGNRIIYFPGLIRPKEHVQAYMGNQLKWDEEFDVDHISLEKDRRTWHITSQNSRSHLGNLNFPTIDIGEGRTVWFGMSISTYSVLWPVSQKTTVVAKSPKSDVHRREKVFMEAREGSQYQILEPHPESDKISPTGFFHVSIIVGPRNFKTYEGEKHNFPLGSLFITPPLEGEIQLPVRHHRVSLSSDLDLQITTAKVPRSLKLPVVFTANVG
jgi:hypothetical protein